MNAIEQLLHREAYTVQHQHREASVVKHGGEASTTMRGSSRELIVLADTPPCALSVPRSNRFSRAHHRGRRRPCRKAQQRRYSNDAGGHQQR